MRTVLRLLVAIATVLAIARPASADITISKGGAWHLRTKASVTACAQGRCSTSRAGDERDIDLPEGAIVRIVLQVFSCPVEMSDWCALVPAKPGERKLRRCDRLAVQSILRECSPYPKLRLTSIGGFERQAADGTSFDWKAVVGFTVRVSGQTVSVVVPVTVHGDWIGGRLRSAAPADLPAAVLPVVPDGLVEAAIVEALHR